MRPKELVLLLANRVGVVRAIGRTPWRRRRLLILCYHGVSSHDEHLWDPQLYVTPEHLEDRVATLREEGCTILPLGDALAALENNTLPPRAVAITFDDGAHDFATQAVPLLVKFNAPATLYLTSYYSDDGLPVFDTALSYLLWKGRRSGADLAPLTGRPEGSACGALRNELAPGVRSGNTPKKQE